MPFTEDGWARPGYTLGRDTIPHEDDLRDLPTSDLMYMLCGGGLSMYTAGAADWTERQPVINRAMMVIAAELDRRVPVPVAPSSFETAKPGNLLSALNAAMVDSAKRCGELRAALEKAEAEAERLRALFHDRDTVRKQALEAVGEHAARAARYAQRVDRLSAALLQACDSIERHMRPMMTAEDRTLHSAWRALATDGEQSNAAPAGRRCIMCKRLGSEHTQPRPGVVECPHVWRVGDRAMWRGSRFCASGTNRRASSGLPGDPLDFEVTVEALRDGRPNLVRTSAGAALDPSVMPRGILEPIGGEP